MAGLTNQLTVVGNVTGDPELRFTQSGSAVANFTVAHTPRTFDRQANEWRDGETLFLRCAVWNKVAENVAESITKGTRVIVTGNLTQRNWEDQNGNKRVSIELAVDEVAPSLAYASAQITRNPQNNAGGGGGGNNNAPRQNNSGSQSQGVAPSGWDSGSEPPF